MSRSDVAKPPIRRQIVWTMLARHSGLWEQFKQSEIDRVVGLMEDNLQENANDSTSMRLWLRSIRKSRTAPSLDAVVEKVGYWKANSRELESVYYLYVLHALSALDGSQQARLDMDQALEECRAISRFRRDRHWSFEWIGAGTGLSRLLHRSGLGEWSGNFWSSTDALSRVVGRIKSIEAPQKGTIETSGGFQAFFVPNQTGITRGRDENALVDFFLGFSYDGPSAWDVRRQDA